MFEFFGIIVAFLLSISQSPLFSKPLKNPKIKYQKFGKLIKIDLFFKRENPFDLGS